MLVVKVHGNVAFSDAGIQTKVEELEKASEAANHENTQLRAQVERMSVELKQYKQKMALMSSKTSLREKVPFGNAAVSNLGDVNFEFNFPFLLNFLKS